MRDGCSMLFEHCLALLMPMFDVVVCHFMFATRRVYVTHAMRLLMMRRHCR